MSSSDLCIQKLCKEYPTPNGSLSILRDLNLELKRGQALAITGPSGCGKSTLLNILGALEAPTSGTVILEGQNPYELNPTDLSKFRNETIGFIFQDHHLLPQCSVLENVLIPTLVQQGATPEKKTLAKSLLERVGLSERLTHRPAQLSGGERQRVAVCRSLINQPTLLLADEPTGNLDPHTAESIGSLLLEMSQEQNTILIGVTHSETLANRFQLRHELDNGKLNTLTASSTSSTEA